MKDEFVMDQLTSGNPLGYAACPRCGEAISADMLFCSYCGNSLNAQPRALEGPATPAARARAEWPQLGDRPPDGVPPSSSAQDRFPGRLGHAGNVPPQVPWTLPGTGARTFGQNQATVGSTKPLRGRARCSQHPEIVGAVTCGICLAAVCHTCAFPYEGPVNVCPACVSKPSTEMPAGRLNVLICSYLAAAWATIGCLKFLSMALSPAEHPDPLTNIIIIILCLFPALAGGGLAVGAYEKRLPNTPAVWGSILWNGLTSAFVIVLAVLMLFASLTRVQVSP